MRIFIDFWRLETKNSLLHVFSFLHKLSFENSFYFLSILSCQTNFLVSKIENCFWKQKIREKKQLPNIRLVWLYIKKKKKKKKVINKCDVVTIICDIVTIQCNYIENINKKIIIPLISIMQLQYVTLLHIGIVLADLGFFGLERMSREGHMTK